MARRPLRLLLTALAVAAAGLLTACSGSDGIELSKGDPLYPGAELFVQRCSGCHTFSAAGTQGSAAKNEAEYKDGPNFNERAEPYEDVLYAIQNGGFSSGPMPQNIVTGEEAERVACFVAKYSGRDAADAAGPGKDAPAVSGPAECRPDAG